MKLILLAASLPLLAACAAAPGEVPMEEKRFATGSNIPMRNRDVHTMTPEAFEQVKNQGTANTGRSRSP